MKRLFAVLVASILMCALFLCGCSEKQIDRSKELKRAMDTCDSKWTQSFPKGADSFRQISDYISGWGEHAGLTVTDQADHYIVLTNPATKGMKKSPSVTMALSADPANLRNEIPTLSLGMTSLLGPMEHGRIRLIVTEAAEGKDLGASEVGAKLLSCDHFISLDSSTRDAIYTAGPLSSLATLTSEAGRTQPHYESAFRIRLQIPSQLDPYTYDQEHSLPNPINVLGDLLASAKSSGRLFDIASFQADDNGEFLPSWAEAVVVIDENNIDAFRKRFDKSHDAFAKRFEELDPQEITDIPQDTAEEPAAAPSQDPLSSEEGSGNTNTSTDAKADANTDANTDGNTDADTESSLQQEDSGFVYTMLPEELPEKVLKRRGSDNIISLMYTLQTGIHLQDETTGEISAASYIRSVSTKDGKFRLTMDMRSRTKSAMEEMTGNYLITSGLSDVNYENTSPRRFWSCKKDSSLAAWFLASAGVDGTDTICLTKSECDQYYQTREDLDIISYHYQKEHRGEALENLLAYMTSLSAAE